MKKCTHHLKILFVSRNILCKGGWDHGVDDVRDSEERNFFFRDDLIAFLGLWLKKRARKGVCTYWAPNNGDQGSSPSRGYPWERITSFWRGNMVQARHKLHGFSNFKPTPAENYIWSRNSDERSSDFSWKAASWKGTKKWHNCRHCSKNAYTCSDGSGAVLVKAKIASVSLRKLLRNPTIGGSKVGSEGGWDKTKIGNYIKRRSCGYKRNLGPPSPRTEHATTI